ncbi:hypothetical protein KW785_01665 [Candidatus Parcubacteria bacterium]|nr:hypothetical protein [Candidatus Parcubacteria bacterium]
MKKRTPAQLLKFLNEEYLKLHKEYERLFWISYMGDHSVDKKMEKAVALRDGFASNANLRNEVVEDLRVGSEEEKTRLRHWLRYFDCYQTPDKLKKLKEKINSIETRIKKKQTTAKEGYIDPKTNKFVKASRLKMGTMIRTEKDEVMRKAYWDGIQKLATANLTDYVKRSKLLNTYARTLGFEDFYAYKIHTEEGMTKKELFKIFDDLHKKTKYALKDIRKLEKKQPGLRKPWNFSFMMSGDFTKEDDQYYPFDQALTRWGRSFAALNIDFKGGKIVMDLLDRTGKYSNGFCHYPDIVHFNSGKRLPGAAGLTCNVVYGQLGSAANGYHTLFHEGGHAADRLNSEQREACLNTEYPPASTAWAETHSQFLDTIYSSIEWRTRYAKNEKGEAYPFDLFERKVKRLNVLSPLGFTSMMAVCAFERDVYEEENLTEKKVIAFARKTAKKYFDYSVDTLWLLNVPHIYGWEATCSYHGYGLAELALMQWREYFYKKYGYIVDNPNVGREMNAVWKLGSSKTFKEFVKLATGKSLSAEAAIKDMTMKVPEVLKEAKSRIARLKRVPEHKGKIDLNAHIVMQSKLKTVADNRKSFEDMARKYAVWLKRQKA